MHALPGNLLGHLTSMTALALVNCELDAVPAFVTGAPALQSLSLAGVRAANPSVLLASLDDSGLRRSICLGMFALLRMRSC